MLLKITIENGVVVDVGTSEPTLVQILDLDTEQSSTFETVAQPVTFEVDDPGLDALLNHEVMSDPLITLFQPGGKES